MKKEVFKKDTSCLAAEIEVREPSLYQVLLHNDDFTPMEFVVGVLESFFYMSRSKAAEIMLEAHRQGKAVCGLFSKDVAESTITQVIEYARTKEHPLTCSMEAVTQ